MDGIAGLNAPDGLGDGAVCAEAVLICSGMVGLDAPTGGGTFAVERDRATFCPCRRVSHESPHERAAHHGTAVVRVHKVA